MLKRYSLRKSALMTSLLLLTFILAACSLGGGDTTNTATPTTQATPALQMLTYQGDGYTLNYPHDWEKKDIGQGAVSFTDKTTQSAFYVVSVANPDGAAPPDVLTQTIYNGVIKKEVQNTQPMSVASSKTVSGVAWKQSALTGKVQGVDVQLYSLSTNHPDHDPSTKAYAIYYIGAASLMPQLDSIVFEPMLQSFKFTA
jgi:hypothetical protein